jgi:hypothetical protein
MKTKDLASVLNSADVAEAWTDDSHFGWFATALSQLPHVEGVSVRAARIPDGADAPRPADPVLCHDTPGLEADHPAGVGDLRFFGKPAVLHPDHESEARLVQGPNSTDANLTAQRDCVFVRVQLPHIVVWFLVYMAKAQPIGLDGWAHGLRALVCRLLPASETPRALRRRFFERLVSYKPVEPEQDLSEICESWREVARADWCWLWLVNRLDPEKSYQLAAASPGDVIPSKRISPADGSVAHYACRVGGCVWIPDVTTWTAVLNGSGYEVKAREELIRLGGPALECIPLFGPTSDESAHDLVSVISLHYRQARRRPIHDAAILRIMGSLTARSINLTQEHLQHQILAELNRIAATYLAKQVRPSESRPQFLEEVITLVKRSLKVEYVSVFQRARFEKAVECIGTTGIWDVATGNRLPSDALTRARYATDELGTRTVQCFVNNEPIITKNADQDPDSKFSERMGLPPRPGGFDPTIYVPIPDPLWPSAKPALGVIRCYRHASPIFRGDFASFDRFDLETLRFIAEQLAPILTTFEFRVRREQTITSIKHDLYAPAAMIRDTVNQLITDYEAGGEIRAIDLYDLRTTSGVLQNLVGQLDLDPTAVRQFHPRPTLLKGEIVARLCDMLGPMAAEKRVRIHYSGFDAIPRLNLDRELIERALFNLLLNAIKYATNGTVIEVRAARDRHDRGFLLDLCNEGIGVADYIPEDDLFLPGYRAPETREIAMGVGLGLTIARAAVERHGGTLRLHHRKGPTIFRMALPSKLEVS